MDDRFHLAEDPDYSIRDSARDSVRFAHRCLEPTVDGRWRAVSTFVDAEARVMHWHDFGDLEGPGWAANAMGGAYLLYRWAIFDHCHLLEHVARGLVDHVLDDGFVQSDGFIVPYRDTARDRLCLNFKHTDDWICPGSMAKIALQMLWMAEILPTDDARTARLLAAAARTAEWLLRRLTPMGDWYPRRCTAAGAPYLLAAEGGDEPLADCSADGLYIVWLLLELTSRGIGDLRAEVRPKLDHVLALGGLYASINHDTYDREENVARAETFRVMTRAARLFDEPKYREFAYGSALPGLDRFKMADDRNGVRTRGLLFMEDTWDTAYLWENAEIALAYHEAYKETRDARYRSDAATILRAIARHHYGSLGFLTEGVDWNNHVGQQHHVDGAEFGAIAYTEPLLNNLHHLEPAVALLSDEGMR